jgi:hypothetical protein
VTLELDPQITRVRFIYPDIDPEEQTPIPEEAFPDEEGKVEITAFCGRIRMQRQSLFLAISETN